MKYKISEDRSKLTITVDDEERQELREWNENNLDQIGTDSAMWDFFEHLICNSELDWIQPEETYDLTSAPMLGIRDEQENITSSWAFMDYCVRSVLEDLRDKGEAVFVGGDL